jgi:O-methyltransferase
MQSSIERARPYTMTTPERLAAVCMAVEHVVTNKIPGAFVECGVWRGGSSMAAALTYLQLGRKDTDLFLFDTFEGMSQPGEDDIQSITGEFATQLLAKNDRSAEIWAYAPIADVRQNLEGTGYPASHLHFVKGKVEDTIPRNAPDQISILRLDTDWYESTRHELIHLFPRLAKNGILIIDDYGAWAGARKAVDEYFAAHDVKPFLARIDNTGRIYVNA